MMLVPIDDVVYLRAELKYVTIKTRTREFLTEESLTALEAEFGDRFVRIHRNALVAKSAVRALERRVMDSADSGRGEAAVETWAVRLAPLNEWLAVSRRQLAAVREALRR